MTLTHRCAKCETIADRPKHDPVNTVLSCACGAYQRIQFADPAEGIREMLERAEAKHHSNPFLASLRSQFEARGTLSEKQREGLERLAGPKEKA